MKRSKYESASLAQTEAKALHCSSSLWPCRKVALINTRRVE